MANLSPEDRQRIYQEEKARLEAQEDLKHEQKGKRRRTFFRIVLLTIGLLVTIAALSPKTPSFPPSSKEKAEAKKTTAARLKECTKQLEEATKIGVVYKLGGKGARPQVIVGSAWFSLPIDAKEAFHEVVQCYAVKGTGGAITSLEYRHWQTGNVVGETSYTGGLKVLP